MLKEIVIQTRKVDLPGGASFDVHGLTIADLAAMMGPFKTELAEVFNDGANIPELAAKAPLFVATLIAVAAGEPDAVENAQNLPFGAQLTALEAIWELTLPDEDALGKLLARLEAVVSQSLPGPKVSAASKSAIGTSGQVISEL